MGSLQRLWADAHPYMDIDGQKWLVEAREGCTEVRRVGSEIRIYFESHELTKACLEKLQARNISSTIGWDGCGWEFVSVGYDFRNRRPRRDIHTKEEIILD